MRSISTICNMANLKNQDDHIKTALRLPRELHTRIQEFAQINERSMNAEIVARLQSSFNDRSSEPINFSLLRKLLDRFDTEEKMIEASVFLESKKK